MYCENCGKQLIRGYAFCIECGSPVPPEVLEEGGMPGRSDGSDDNNNNAGADEKTAENAAEEVSATMPGIQPIGENASEETLVFCPNCGMRMQKNKDFCEKCGMKISDKPSGSVPLINTNPMSLDGGFDGFGGNLSDFSENDINQINSFMSGMGSDMPSAYGNEEETQDLFGANSFSANDIATLNRQMSNFSASASEMPEVSKRIIHQKEPEDGGAIKLENFSMSGDFDEDIPITDGAVRVIEGGSMDENPDADISLDPFNFLGNSMDEAPAAAEPVVSVEEVEPVVPVAEVEPVAPVAEVEPVAPVAEVEPVVPVAGVEPIAPVAEVEPIAPVAEVEPIAPVEEVEPIAPVAEVEPVAPVAEVEAVAPVAEVEPVAPVAEVEPIAPVAEVEPVAPVAEVEPFAPVTEVELIAPIEEVEPIAPVAEVEPVAPVAEVEPVAPVAEVEPVAPVAEVEPVAPVAEVEPVAPVAEVEPVAPVAEVEPVAPVEEVEPVAPAEEKTDADNFDDFIPEEMGFISESSAVLDEEPEKAVEPAAAAPAAAAMPEGFDFRRPQNKQTDAPEEEKHEGNLVYCRTCGQDMYDTEKFCKNCGATYKGAYVPPRNAPSSKGGKETPMIFGKIPLPKFIGGVAAVLGIAAAILFLVQPWNMKNPDITGEGTQNSSSSAVSSSDNSSASSADSESSASSENNTSDSESTSSDAASSGSDVSSSTENGSSSGSKSSSSSKKSSSSSSTRPVVITGNMSAKVKSLEQDREKMMEAVELIAGEVGKMEALSHNVIYAISNSSASDESAMRSFYSRDLAKGFLSSLNSGKAKVDSAVRAAAPKNSELNSLYTSLKTLKSRYETYYNFIKSPKGDYTSFTNNCASYYTSFTSALTNLNLSKFTTSSYTSANKNSAYASMVSSAVASARNATGKLSTLQSKLTGLGSGFSSKAFNTLSANASTYASAAGYAMQVKAYAIMLNGVSSGYSGALNHLNSAYSSMSGFIESYSYIQENEVSNFRTESQNAIYNANSYANKAASVIS